MLGSWSFWIVGHFHRHCVKLRSPSQSGNSTNTVIGQMTHTLTANSPITDVEHKSLLKEMMSIKVAKKRYKQKYQQVRVNVASTAATSVTTGLKSTATTATVASALKELKTTSAVTPKVAVPSTHYIVKTSTSMYIITYTIANNYHI